MRPASTPISLSRRLAFLLAAVSCLLPGSAGAAKPGRPPKAVDPDAAIVLPVPRSFDAAVEAVAAVTGSRPSDLELGGRILLASEGRAFASAGHLGTLLIAGSHEPYLQAGYYLFRLERSFGLGGSSDVLALVATTDREALVRRVGTSDPTGKASTEAIVAWLAALEKDEPFVLDEIGSDYLAGRFKRTPKDPAAVARRCAEIAPELVKGHENMLALLAEEIRANRTLYLIW